MVPETVKKRLKKYLNSAQKKVLASQKRDLTKADIHGLFEEIICKVFGFNKQSDLIDLQINGKLCFYFIRH